VLVAHLEFPPRNRDGFGGLPVAVVPVYLLLDASGASARAVVGAAWVK
jgi:hypothetical protein